MIHQTTLRLLLVIGGIVVACALFPCFQLVLDEIQRRNLDTTAKRLAAELGKDASFKNVRVFSIAKGHGYLELSGFVTNELSSNRLSSVLLPFSKRCKVVNRILIYSGDEKTEH